MKTVIFELDAIKCEEFLGNHLQGWVYFTSQIISNIKGIKGKYYCFAASQNTPEELYDFQNAINYDLRPVPDDIVISFIEKHLNSTGENYCLIAEDGMFEPGSKFIIDSKRQYHLVNDIIFYLLKNGDKKEKIASLFRFYGGYGFFPFITEVKLDELKQKENITPEFANTILENVSMFFTPIYDWGSFLFWIKDGHEEILRELKLQLEILGK